MSRKPSKPKKGCWVVTLKATVTRTLIVNDCTREEAENNPYEHEVVDERDHETIDYEVKGVVPYEG